MVDAAGATAHVAPANYVDAVVVALTDIPLVAPKPCQKRISPRSPYCFRIGCPRRPYRFRRISNSLLAVALQFSDSSRFFPREPARSIAYITRRRVYIRQKQPSNPPSRCQ